MTTKHVDHFLRLRSAPDLLPLFAGTHKPAKEISESMGAFLAVRRCLGPEAFGRADVTCYVLGDGKSPRTGALMACMTRWAVISIDPMMRVHGPHPTIRRLTCVRARAETVEPVPGPAVILSVHGHASWSGFWNRVAGPKLGIAIPCCVPHVLDQPADDVLEDAGILSPHRTVLSWLDGSF